MKYFSYYLSPVGKLMLVSDNDKLIAIKGDKHRFLDDFSVGEKENNDLDIFIKTKKWLDDYFKGLNPSIDDIPIYFEGSDFRIEVWKILCDIPYGEVYTYGDIARMIAKKRGLKSMSSQAVGNAIGHNPISIIVPCHRVVGSNNNLVGYGGGIFMKIKLLELEGIDVSKYKIPVRGTAL